MLSNGFTFGAIRLLHDTHEVAVLPHTFALFIGFNHKRDASPDTAMVIGFMLLSTDERFGG